MFPLLIHIKTKHIHNDKKGVMACSLKKKKIKRIHCTCILFKQYFNQYSTNEVIYYPWQKDVLI